MKTAICARLNKALRDMYHNATPQYPYKLMERYDTLLGCYEGQASYEYFNSQARFEVDYMNDGGFCGLKPYHTMRHNAKASPAKKRMLRREYARDAALVPWIALVRDYGPLYTYGRGGRTLAPRGLMAGRGIIKQFECGDMNNAEAVELIQAVEAFNAHVAEWNSKGNLAEVFSHAIFELEADLRAELKTERKRALSLVRDIKLQRPKAGPVCDALRQVLALALSDMGNIKSRLAVE